MSHSAENPNEFFILAKRLVFEKIEEGLDKNQFQKSLIVTERFRKKQGFKKQETQNALYGLHYIRNSLNPVCVKSGMGGVVISDIRYLPNSSYPVCVKSG